MNLVPVPQEPIPQLKFEGLPHLQPEHDPPVSKKRSFLFPVIMIFILLALGSALGYIYFQNMQLKQKLIEIKPVENIISDEPIEPSMSLSNQTSKKRVQRELWEFEVPVTWNYLECSSNLIFVGPSIERDQTVDCAFDGSPGTIQVYRITDKKSVKIPDVNSTEPLVTERTEKMVGGKTAIVQTETIREGQGEGTRKYVYINHENYMDIIILHNINEETIFNTVLSTFTYVSIPVSVTPTQKVTEVPPGWINHEFPAQKLILHTPDDWASSIQEYPESSSSLIRFWKKAMPNLVPVQLEIKPSWDNTGNAKDLPRTFLIGSTIQGAKIDPPKKEQQTLERYQTNVFFEHENKIYVFQCVHNWAQDYVDTCNTIMETLAFQM